LSTTGSIGPSGGTVSRCAQKKSAVPPSPFVAGTEQYRLPICEPVADAVSSSSTSSPSARRSATKRSATARSRPGGDGIAASSRNRLSARDASGICPTIPASLLRA
jgi:hypothetical protein